MTTTAEKTAAPAPDKRRALGRGLDSLLPGPRAVAAPPAAIAPPPVAETIPQIQAQRSGDEVREIPLDLIDNNPHQTRYFFDQTMLQELSESITANGVVQPVVVRPAANGRYTLVLGERRCRASKLAGKESIPAIVRTVSEQQAAEMTVVENLQRHDLNCIEQANAFAKLSREFGLTQEAIGKRVGVSRESVSNHMRLLKLPASVMQYLQEGRLGFSEARVLLTLLDANLIPKIADEAVKKHLSVMQLEDLVFATNVPMQKPAESEQRAKPIDPNVRAAQTELERVLGTRVRIRDRKGKGKIVIEYGTLEDFDRVVEILAGKSH